MKLEKERWNNRERGRVTNIKKHTHRETEAVKNGIEKAIANEPTKKNQKKKVHFDTQTHTNTNTHIHTVHTDTEREIHTCNEKRRPLSLFLALAVTSSSIFTYDDENKIFSKLFVCI